ncbi:amino acid ABC transporter permease [Pseudomonas sp. ADAK13]|uniref:amino acid ABC transporter permease n=1 Tax=Pseudomonas sp. ADAK13 TaxID=2730847 RepID=UPI001462D0BB|nr:amino acid ABC transporter permease [Pseudomonas sp. ADAK13]QJI37943.1 amino acid ABC transporter permease [Pseudomonas sp. ADAK13]
MSYIFDFSFLQEYWPNVVDGIIKTLYLSVVSMVLGLVVGSLTAVGRSYGPRSVRVVAVVYVELVRNTPLIIQVFWLFFGLAVLQFRIGATNAAIIALAINAGAYTAEIIRAGLGSIHRGQTEAASCLALTKYQLITSILLPQALEKMYPALVSQFVLLMLASSLMSQISVEELTGVAYMIQSFTFRGFEVYLIIAAVYLVLAILIKVICFWAAAYIFPRKRRIQRSVRLAQ